MLTKPRPVPEAAPGGDQAQDGAADQDEATATRFSVYDGLQSAPRRGYLRRLPGVLHQCLTLVWQASGALLVWLAVLQLAAGIAAALQLLAAKFLISDILAAERAGEGLGDVVPEAVLLVGTALFLTIAGMIQSEQQRVGAELVTRRVEDLLLQVAVAVDLEAFETPAFLDRLHRAQAAGQSRPWPMTFGLLSFLGNGITMLGIAVAVCAIEPVLLPLVSCASLPLAFATVRNSRASHAVAFELTASDRERRYLAHVLMGSGFATEVRVFGLAPFLRRGYDGLYDRRIAALRRLARQRLRRSITAGLATGALTAVGLGVIVLFVLSDRMDLAAATAAAVGIQQLAVRLRAVYSCVGTLFEGALFLEDFNAVLELQPVLEQRQPQGPTPAGFRTLTVENLTFSYPGTDRRALADISLRINEGEVVALVGENGSGKTTMAKLLCHLYRPTSGRILWDAVDTATCDPTVLRRSVTGIFQDFARYHLSARDNIAIGRYERRDDVHGVIAAARQAGADGFLADLPRGYESRLGRQFEGGYELSIGQWQRIALARAFFRDARLIVLDEPTAALDPRAEREFFDGIRDLARGRTVVLISHRFSSVRAADRIFVLDAGRLIDQGPHDELMARGGLYQQLFTLQASAYLGEGHG